MKECLCWKTVAHLSQFPLRMVYVDTGVSIKKPGMPQTRYAPNQVCPKPGKPQTRYASNQVCPKPGMPQTQSTTSIVFL